MTGTMPGMLIAALAVLALLVLVGLRRGQARRWAGGSVERGATAGSFDTTWLQTSPPRAAMRAYKDRRIGVLMVDSITARAEFRANSGEVLRLDPVVEVQVGRRGSDLINTWIAVKTNVDGAPPSVVYLNDGGWLGWRALLTGSNRRIFRSLAALQHTQE